MPRRLRTRLTLLAVSAVAAATLAAPVAAAPGSQFPDVIELPNGWAPEGITAGRGTTVFVGSLATGGVWRGDVRTGIGDEPDDPFIAGLPGDVSVGVEYEAGADRLWVAGGPTGEVRVYDATSGERFETYTFEGAGFLNDIVVTRDAAYVTDSFAGHIAVIPLGPGGQLPDPADVETLELGGDFELQAGFNLNGIVATRGWLIAVQSSTGTLFRIDAETGDATAITLLGTDALPGDGLELRGSTLFVVTREADPPSEYVAELKLGPQLEAALLVDTHTSSSFAVPTTAAFVAGNLYVVNARFGTPVTPDTEYWLTTLDL